MRRFTLTVRMQTNWCLPDREVGNNRSSWGKAPPQMLATHPRILTRPVQISNQTVKVISPRSSQQVQLQLTTSSWLKNQTTNHAQNSSQNLSTSLQSMVLDTCFPMALTASTSTMQQRSFFTLTTSTLITSRDQSRALLQQLALALARQLRVSQTRSPTSISSVILNPSIKKLFFFSISRAT